MTEHNGLYDFWHNSLKKGVDWNGKDVNALKHLQEMQGKE